MPESMLCFVLCPVFLDDSFLDKSVLRVDCWVDFVGGAFCGSFLVESALCCVVVFVSNVALKETESTPCFCCVGLEVLWGSALAVGLGFVCLVVLLGFGVCGLFCVLDFCA